MAANNPRKFEEKIAQHKLRQAQETKEFEKIMEEMSFVNAKAHHNQRQTRGRYGGSLPDFNLAQSQSARHENLNDVAMRMDNQSPLKDRQYHPRNRLMTANRRHNNMENTAPYHHFSPYLSPPQIDSNWRRTSSDSSIYHNLTNPNASRKMSTSPDSTREVGSFLAPKDNELEEMNRMSNSGQQQQQQSFNFSNNGSLPDLSNLHIPSPLSVAIDQEEQQQQQPQQQYNQNFSPGNSNVFMNRQPRRNTTGSSCKRQVYRHHPPHLDHLQMPGPYVYQQPPANVSDPTSPTVAPMYQAPMSPLANGSGYLQVPGLMGSGSLQQQLEQMATIAENMKPINAANGQMGQGIPPQSPNTLFNMLTQNPQAMESVRQRFQDVFGNGESNDVDLSGNNSLAADIGNAIGGFDSMRGYPGSFGRGGADFQGGLSLEPLDIQDFDIITGQSADAKAEVEEEFRREGNQQQLMR